MTRWSPDTCGCVIDFKANGEEVEVVAVVTKCPKHADTPHDKHHFETVLAHNRRKNHVHNAVVEHLQKTKPGARHEDVAVVYDDKDDLHVHGSGLSEAEQKAALGNVKVALGSATIKFVG
jgi:hypothetical protein